MSKLHRVLFVFFSLLYVFFLNHPGLFHRDEKHSTLDTFRDAYGEWAVVCGATQGLGLAWTRALAKRGLSVILVARDVPRLDATKASLEKEFPSVKFATAPVNLKDIEAWTATARELQRAHRVGFLVHNAAHIALGHVLDHPLEIHLTSTQVNDMSLLVAVDVFLKPMVERKKGAFVVVSSVSGEGGATYGGVYAATKKFGAVLAESLWAETERMGGVDVLAVLPGLTATPTLEAIMNPEKRHALFEADPDDVVAEALRGLGRGPVVYPGAIPKIVALLQWVLPAPVRLRASELIEDSYKTGAELIQEARKASA